MTANHVKSGYRLLITLGVQAGTVFDVPLVGTLGRSRKNAVRLQDTSISRVHLELRTTDQGLEISVLDGATPILVDARSVSRATLNDQDAFAVGKTNLRVLRAPSMTKGHVEQAERAQVEEPTIERTTRAQLFDGEVGELRALSSLFEFLEALDRATSDEAILRAFEAWAIPASGAVRVILDDAAHAPGNDHAGDVGAHVVEEQPNQRRSGPLTIKTWRDRSHVRLPWRGARMTLDVELPTPRVSPALLRLFALASALISSAQLRNDAAHVIEEDRTILRAQAIGSSSEFLGGTPAARTVAAMLPRLAASDVTALLLGESGVGKTYFARLIHEQGKRSTAPFRVVNCAAIPESLVESELFGHERGAFTGAHALRVGAFESAGAGTLFLDEIGELPLASQAKLLRALEEKTFERLGSNRPIPLRARVLTATNRDLQQMIQAGRFRADLYFRVSVVHLTIPPLRERADDVVSLANQFLGDLKSSAGRRIHGFASDAVATLRAYDWPGNVRELRNAIEHAIVMGDGEWIVAADLPTSVTASAPIIAVSVPPPVPNLPVVDVAELPASLAWLEAKAIDAALRATNGNRSKAAAVLGINRVTLYKKLRGSSWAAPTTAGTPGDEDDS